MSNEQQPKEEYIEVFDFETKRIGSIPESQVGNAIKSGRFGLRKGTKLNVMSPQGDYGTISSEEAEKAFKLGYDLDYSYNRQQRSDEVEYSDKGLQAFAAGAASGLSFGISDQALIKSGLYSQEELNNIYKYNPVESTVGEVAGFVAPLLFSGGTSAIAGAAAKGATKLTGKAIAKELAKTTIKASGLPVKSVIKAGEAAEKATSAILKKILKDKGSKTFARGVIDKMLPQAIKGAVETSAYSVGRLISEDALGNAQFNGENLLATIEHGAIVGGTIGGIFGTAAASTPYVKGYASKASNFIKKKTVLGKDKVNAALDLIGVNTPAGKAAFKVENEKIIEEIPEFLVKQGKVSTWSNSKSIYDNLLNTQKNAHENIGIVLEKANNVLKREMGAINKINNSFPTVGLLSKNIVKELDEIIKKYSGSVKSHFESELAPLKKIREGWAKQIDDNKLLTPKRLYEDRKILNAKLKNKWKAIKSGSIDNLALEVQADGIAITQINNQIDDVITLLETSGDSSIQGALSEFKAANHQYSIATTLLKNASKKVEKDAGKSLIGLQEILVALKPSPLAILTTAGKKAFESDMHSRLVLLNQVQKRNQKVTEVTTNIIKKFIGLTDKTKDVVKKITPFGSISILNRTNFNPMNRKPPGNETRQQAFKRVKTELGELVSRPMETAEHIERNISALTAVAPNIANNVGLTATRMYNFLNTKIPRSYASSISFQPDFEEFEPSSTELAKFERYVQGATDPMGVLTDFENGITNYEGFEAIKQVYPSLFSFFQETVINNISNLKEKLSYNKRLELSLLLELPTDASLESANLVALQEQFGAQQAETEQQQEQFAQKKTKINSRILSNAGLAKREASESQKLIARR